MDLTEELDRIDTEIMSQKVKLKWTYAGTASYCRKLKREKQGVAHS